MLVVLLLQLLLLLLLLLRLLLLRLQRMLAALGSGNSWHLGLLFLLL